MLKALLREFHCEGKVGRSSAVVLISSLTTYEIFYGTKPKPDEKENAVSKCPAAVQGLKDDFQSVLRSLRTLMFGM